MPIVYNTSWGTTTWSTSSSITITGNWTTGTTSGWHYLGTINEGPNITAHYERVPAVDPERLREHRERVERERVERRREFEEAQERARTLLLSFLSEGQRRSFEVARQFEVIGSAGGRYRIRTGTVGNIDWFDEDGGIGGSLCCHPIAGDLPIADVMLAQMLALITDEEGFVRLANRHTGYHHPLRRAAVNA